MLARTIVRRLLHEPTRRLRADGTEADATLEVFGVAVAPAGGPPAAGAGAA